MTGEGIALGVTLLFILGVVVAVVRRVREEREFKARLRRMER